MNVRLKLSVDTLLSDNCWPLGDVLDDVHCINT